MSYADLAAFLAAAPDDSGMSSYRMGQIVGYSLLGLIVLLVVKKVVGSRSKR